MNSDKDMAAEWTGTPGTARRTRARRSAEAAITWDRIIGTSGWIKIATLGGLFAWLYFRELRFMLNTWIGDGNWSHGFIIPLFSLYFLHQRRERLLAAQTQRRTNWLGLGLVLVSIFGYMISIYPLKMGYPKLLALLMTLFGLVLFCCGWSTIKVAWLPILYLFFAMPIPARLYEQLTIPMRKWASQIAVVVLNLVPGMDLTARGVVIEGLYKGQEINLSVAEACAGMRLMMAFLALGVAMAYLSDRPYWHRIILVVSTLPIALFCNFMRVIITGLLYATVDPMFAQGGFHTTLGLLMLPVAFFLYWVIAEILNRIYEEVEEEESPAHA